MEVEITVLEKKPHLKRLKRQVSIQDDVFMNRDEDEDVFLHNDKFEHRFESNKSSRRPFNHRSLKKAKSLNQTIFASNQTGSFDTRKQVS